MSKTEKPTITLMVTGMVESNVTLEDILAIFELDRDVLTTFFNEGDVQAHAFGIKSDEDDEGSMVQIIEKTGSKSPISVSSDDEDVMRHFVFEAAKAGFEVRFRYFHEQEKLFSAHLFRREAVKMEA
jgi:hypothetical protein